MKPVFSLFLIFGLFSCQEEKTTDSSLMHFILPETVMVLKTDDLGDFSKNLMEPSFFSNNSNLSQGAFGKKLSALDQFNTNAESLLGFSMIGRELVYTFITENRPDLIPTAIKKIKPTDRFNYDGQQITKYTVGNSILYSSVLEGKFIGSNSKLIVENIIRMHHLDLAPKLSISTIYSMASGPASLFVQNEKFNDFYEHFFPKAKNRFFKELSNWTVLNIELDENDLFLNGIISENPGERNLFSPFQGIEPEKTEMPNLVPLNAIGSYSFTYPDFSVFGKQLDPNKKSKLSEKSSALFNSAKEIGVIYFSEGKAVALRSTNVEKSRSSLSQEIATEFRGQPIYTFGETAVFHEVFKPFPGLDKLKFYSQLGPYFVFSEKMEILKNIIANFQHGSVVGKQKYFEEVSENLSDESSVQLIGINENLKNVLAEKVSNENRETIENLNFADYPLSAIQFVRGNGFSHLNIAFKKISAESSQIGTAQLMALELENPLVGNPQFFDYWRTGEQYIVAQDVNNFLYLFNNKGELRWKRQLDSQILGKIRPVDLFKNKRLQLAFATSGKFYVLDRNGNEVAPFPMDFDEPITQPLSIFDYAGNRDYRFVLVQNRKVSMLNSAGKKVQGFELEKTGSPVVQAPKHFRIGTKDYIVIAESSGKLNILNRQGKIRVKVEKDFDFSTNQWFLHEDKFTSTNAAGNLVQIDEGGIISTTELDFSENHKIAILSDDFAGISENMLYINGTKLELDYGMYTAPKIFDEAGETYFGLTDTQEGKVYLFDEDGKLIPGFPVYGNSIPDVDNMDNKGKLEFVVKGEENRILVYAIN